MKRPEQAVLVSTAEYEAAHGAKPRGAGHWAFSLTDGRIIWQCDYMPEYTEATGGALLLYGEAKRAAQRYALLAQHKFIEVAP